MGKTEYKNEGEALEAAEKKAIWNLREGRIVEMITPTEIRHKNPAENYGWCHEEFTYPPPVEVPKKGTLCEFWNDDEKPENPHIGRFNGLTSDSIIPYECARAISSCTLKFRHFEPVEIVRNGRHARALELLRNAADNFDMGSLAEREISTFLDEPEKGGTS